MVILYSYIIYTYRIIAKKKEGVNFILTPSVMLAKSYLQELSISLENPLLLHIFILFLDKLNLNYITGRMIKFL